jgi:hypothetical protein
MLRLVCFQTLSHKCPQLADPYEPLPKHVKLIYDGKKVDLCPGTMGRYCHSAFKLI